MTLLRLCRVDEIGDDAPLRAEAGGMVYAVIEAGGDYFVLADQCTHGPGNLSEGTVIDGAIECPFHQGRFDLKTGAPVYPPCTEPVRAWTARVVDGDIFIDPAESAKA